MIKRTYEEAREYVAKVCNRLFEDQNAMFDGRELEEAYNTIANHQRQALTKEGAPDVEG